MNLSENTERTLRRHVLGELSAEEHRRMEERLASDPKLAAQRDRLVAVWNRLDLPTPEPVPLGFATRITARVRARERSTAVLPPWVRSVSAAALAGGLLLGAGVGSLSPAPGAEASGAELVATDPSLEVAEAGDLTDDYWRMIEGLEVDPATDGGFEG